MGYTAYPDKRCPHHSLSPEGQKWWAGWGEASREANDRGRERSLVACGDCGRGYLPTEGVCPFCGVGTAALALLHRRRANEERQHG